MKLWTSKKKSDADKSRAKLTETELSDDLLAQITGGAGKGACHTLSTN